MNDAQGNENHFYRFLLGDLRPDEQEQIEIRLLEDGELQEVIQAAEFDLIDDYIRGDLSTDDISRFERIFLNSPARRRKLATSRILLNSNTEVAEAIPSADNLSQSSRRPKKNMTSWSMAVRIAAGALLLVGIGVVGGRVLLPWWQVREGMSMLNDAYSKGRPIEARLSGFRYAPWEKDRSSNEQLTDYALRDQANLTLLEVARAHPNAKTHQALGISYLLKGEINEAIDQFKKALTYDPSNARIHNCLGAAFMQFAIIKQRQLDQLNKSNTPLIEHLSGEILSDLSQANEHFSQAMQQDSLLAEGVFNQALCLERLGLIDQALDRWESYLKLDHEGEWAKEAREKQEALKKRKDRTFFDTERIFRNFLAAYDSGDEENIWQSFMRGCQQNGNLITELLLDQYLESFVKGRRAEAQNKLEIVTTAG